MREIHHTEHVAVSGGLTTSDVNDWIWNLLRPKPSDPYVNPFPSDSANMETVKTFGKIIVVAALTGIAAMIRFGSRR
ncbi:hypothetical protein KDW69_23020 [Burkholderia ambifaria]|uniref:hypothetical protein n=1 Tax=Burkholderia ambifaria TaxID=152480 RepID=UPI00158B0A6B|nr:hypothetical protein [Burkholderia ambifaria]MBR8334534.1 hypothetical protein [Burkholderia ambifaria]